MSDAIGILVLNAGSSSLKFSLIQWPQQQETIKGLAERLGEAESTLRLQAPEALSIPLASGATHETALQALQPLLARYAGQFSLTAIAHRVVHGGEHFKTTARLSADMLQTLEKLSHLAPLHNPANLAGIRAATTAWPGLPQYAVFDTAFHQSMPASAYLYALPQELYREHGIRRYGFHGTSHAYVSARLRELEPGEASRRVITAHLGNGCSMAAILDGRSVDTSMGMTPLEGLVMGTRSGDLDPGVLLFLLEQCQYSPAQLNQLLNKKSGLLGISGLSNDVRSLLQAKAEGHAGARLALDIFTYRAAKAAAALVVPLGGLDALVFTGGIGENATPIRQQIVTQLGFLGLQLDPERNAALQGAESCISTPGGPSVWVIPTQEERMMAREAYSCMKAEHP